MTIKMDIITNMTERTIGRACDTSDKVRQDIQN